MAVIITPRWGYKRQADTYLRSEWYWRGIVDPGIFTEASHYFPSVTTNGDWAGMDSAIPYGTITPATTDGGQIIYELQANNVTGQWRFSLGLTGVDPMPNVNNLYITIRIDGISYNISLEWDSGEKCYIGTNLEAATKLHNAVGLEVGLSAHLLPVNLIHYDFTIIEEVV